MKDHLALSRVGCDALKVVRLSLKFELGKTVGRSADHAQSAPLMDSEPSGAIAGDEEVLIRTANSQLYAS